MNFEELLKTGLILVFGDTDSISITAKYRRHEKWFAKVITNELFAPHYSGR